MIGNSSSGILEMPVFNKSTVNIGIDKKEENLAKVSFLSETDKTKITKPLKKQFLKISKNL